MNKFTKVIDSIVATLPSEHKGGFECQVFLQGGNAIVGVLRKHPELEGIFIITGVAKRSDNERVPSLQVETYFSDESILAINRFQPIDTSGIIIPGGGNGRIIGISGDK
jgi:hypothetical protein